MSAYSELLDYYVERYNEGDLEAVMELYAEDAVQLMPDGLFQGRDAIRDRLAQELNGFTDVQWTFRGTHTAPFPLPDGTELPPTGKRIEIRGMEYVRMRDGKIVVDNLYYDNLGIAAQLGLIPQRATV